MCARRGSEEGQVSPHPSLSIVYVEAQSPLAFALLERVGPEDVTPLPEAQARLFDLSPPSEEWSANIEVAVTSSNKSIDPRLAEALGELSREPGATTIASAARRCDLSESRLRTLAREQLGVPLSTWLIWRKLERAARALATGGSLAAAAHEGGFADQAHFTREMRRMSRLSHGTTAVPAISLRTTAERRQYTSNLDRTCLAADGYSRPYDQPPERYLGRRLVTAALAVPSSRSP